MKKILIAAAFAMTFASYTYAAEAVNPNNQPNNAQAQTNPELITPERNNTAENKAKTFAEMDQHERAAVKHETGKEGMTDAHQRQAERHREMMKSN